MAAVKDAVSGECRWNNVTTATNATASHTVSASADMILLFIEIGLNTGADTAIGFSTMTLGGKAFTHLGSALKHSGANTDTLGFVDVYYMTAASLGSALPSGVSTLSITPTFASGTGLYGSAWSYSIIGSNGAVPTLVTPVNGQLVSTLTLSAGLASGDLIVGIGANGATLPTTTTGTSEAASAAGTALTACDHARILSNSGTGTVSLTWALNSADYSAATGVQAVASTVTPTGGEPGFNPNALRAPGRRAPSSLFAQASRPRSEIAQVVRTGTYPASVDADAVTVLDGSGNPWFGVIDAGWANTNQLNLTDQTTMVSSLAALGFRGSILQGPGILLGDNKPNDIAGNYPWTGTAFQSALNDPYWSRIDTYIDLCASYGITVFLTPAYLGFSGATPVEGWATEITAASNAQMTAYGQALGLRYKSKPNIVWVAGGDRNPDATLLARTDAMMTAIRAAGDTHLMTAHQNQDSTAVDIWSAYSWLDLNSDYTWGGQNAVSFEGAYTQAPQRPTWGIEFLYENYNGSYSQTLGRYQLWASLCEGGFGVVMGVTPRWFAGSVNGPAGVSGSTPYDTWQHSLSSPLTLNAGRLASFVAGYSAAQWKALNPGVALVTTGEGTTTAKAAVGVDTTNGRAVVYFPSSRTIAVDLSVFTPSSLDLRWFDPTNATYTAIGTYANTSGRSVTYPSANSAGDNDWVLVISPAASTITGTLAVTETADTVAVAGTATISGSMAATEGSDAVAVAGTSTITGTLAATATDDTVAVTGTLTISGALSAAEASDVVAAAGSPLLAATLAVTETADTVAVAGTPLLQATLAAAEGADVVSATAVLTITGTLAVTEAADVVAIVGSVGSGQTGTLAAVEAADVVAIAGTPLLVATLTVTEASDAVAVVAVLTISGTMTATDGADVVAMVGTSGNATTGTLVVVEAADAVTAAGVLTVAGALAAVEAGDVVNVSGVLQVTGIITATDHGDVVNIVANSGTIVFLGGHARGGSRILHTATAGSRQLHTATAGASQL